jgi:2-polyprenyl-6-methoxyphenol hydroxylase-like FAD-dependent oxidoreductase
MPGNVRHILDAVTDIEVAVEGSHQTLTLLGGSPVATRLTVLATGLQRTLHRELGERRERLSMHHSITWGFDVHLTQQLEGVAVMYGDTANQIDYLTLFPYEGGAIRGNLFTYGDPALLRASMQDPDGLHTLMPGLRGAIGPVRLASAPVMRSNHLWISHIACPGVVMVGDAFQTPCPAAGTGITRLLSDVQALARHVPRWLQMDDVSLPRIEEYYADSLRTAADAKALHDARYRRAARTETSMGWRMHRWRVHQQHRVMSSLQLVAALLS